MKKYLMYSLLIVSPLLKAQEQTDSKVKPYNRLSVEAGYGLNKGMAPYSLNSTKRFVDFSHVEVSGRYMLSHSFGLQLNLGNDVFQSRKNVAAVNEYKTVITRFTLNFIGNLGKAFSMYDWNKRIGLLGHFGIGYSNLNKDKISLNSDQMLHVTLGLTPQFKITERIVLNLNAAVVGNLRQNITFDYKPKPNTPGLDGYLCNLTLGAGYYIGKNAVHADWYVPQPPKFDSKPLEDKIKKMENDMKDDDGDGVANYLDQETNTAAGATVNTKGVTQVEKENKSNSNNDEDTDGEGTLDNFKKLFFTVQLGVYSNPVPTDVMKNLTPLDTKTMPDGKIRYFSGVFHSVAEATAKLEEARKAGITDAFITAYYKGNRITVAEANAFILEKGEKILQPKQ